MALGITWALDGLEVTLAGSVAAALMLAAAVIQAIWGAAAERKALGDVARPLGLRD